MVIAEEAHKDALTQKTAAYDYARNIQKLMNAANSGGQTLDEWISSTSLTASGCE